MIELIEQFKDSPTVTSIIFRMSSDQRNFFKGLVDGKTFSSTGYQLGVEQEIHNCPVRANELISQHFIPVSKERHINNRHVYFMADEDIQALKNEITALPLIKRVKTEHYKRKSVKRNKDLERINKENANFTHLVSALTKCRYPISKEKQKTFAKDFGRLLCESGITKGEE